LHSTSCPLEKKKKQDATTWDFSEVHLIPFNSALLLVRLNAAGTRWPQIPHLE